MQNTEERRQENENGRTLNWLSLYIIKEMAAVS